MAQNLKIDSNTLIGLIDQFYAEKCDGNAELLKIPQIGEYIRSKGYDVADYIIRRNNEAKAYVEKLQESTEETHIQTVAVYRDLDIDTFLMKNNTKDRLKKALKERENYYRKVTNSAAYSFKENKQLRQQVKDYMKRIKELEKELDSAESKSASLGTDSRNFKAENRKLREIIDTYLYPEIANELLKQQGLLKETARIVYPDIIENKVISAETDITEIKSNLIKGLFDRI